MPGEEETLMILSEGLTKVPGFAGGGVGQVSGIQEHQHQTNES